jgi:hypothetical protein
LSGVGRSLILKHVYKNHSQNYVLVCQCKCESIYVYIYWCMKSEVDLQSEKDRQKNASKLNILHAIFCSKFPISLIFIFAVQ